MAWVPGSFELPYAARRFAETGRFDAVICLGCVIKGETDHNEYINHATAPASRRWVRRPACQAIFGVVTTNSLEQALARARSQGSTNKGWECAVAAVTMANLRRALAE